MIEIVIIISIVHGEFTLERGNFINDVIIEIYQQLLNFHTYLHNNLLTS